MVVKSSRPGKRSLGERQPKHGTIRLLTGCPGLPLPLRRHGPAQPVLRNSEVAVRCRTEHSA